MEMSEKERLFGILCGTVDRSLGTEEYDVVTSLYDTLLKYKLIHAIEDFLAGEIVPDRLGQALVSWIWRALYQPDQMRSVWMAWIAYRKALFESSDC